MAADSLFCTQIWPRDVMWKQSIRLCVLEFGVNPKCRSSPKNEIDGIFRFTPPKSGKSALGMRLTGEYPSGHATGCATGSCWPIMLRSFSTWLYYHYFIFTMKSKQSTFLIKFGASSFPASNVPTSKFPAGIITTILFLSRLVLFRPTT